MPHTHGLATILRDALNKLPLSVNALAKEAGVSQPQISRILAGKRRATPEVVEKVARALDVWGTDAQAAAKALRRGIRQQRGKR